MVPALPASDLQLTLDGLADEPAWSRAAELDGFRQYQPVDGRAAEERTVVRVLQAPDALWFAIRAYDRQPETIRATQADRDNLGSEDRVTLYLDTFNDRRRAYFFTVNALGNQEDGVRSEGASAPGSFGATDDKNPDFIWQSKGRRTADGYEVEVRIPFKSLRYGGGEPLTWGLNVYRYVQRSGYVDTWADTRRGNASLIAQFGTLEGLRDLRRGIVTEIQPALTSSWRGSVASGGFRRETVDGDPGLNLRLGFTSLTADLTVNPDFSQVESDVGLVTINERFALFFPERRPFFLEGVELFATPNTLVYTRQIANPKGGAKLTGKVGRTTVAYVGALDEAPEGDRLANVLRVRRDVGANSTVGAVLTDRRGDGQYNRVAAADARWVFGRIYFVQGQVGRAWTRTGAGVPVRAGSIWGIEADRTGRAWGFNYALGGNDAGFRTQSGFVPRNGIVEGNIRNRLSLYGARGAWVENVTTFVTASWLWRSPFFGQEAALEGRQRIDLSVRLRGGWRPGAEVVRSFTGFDPAAYAGYAVQTADGPAPFSTGPRLSGLLVGVASLTTPTWQQGDVTLRVQRGAVPIFPETSRGREQRTTLTANIRPSGSVRVTGSLTASRITRAADGSEFARTILPRLKVEYQPSRALFFRYVGEYLMQRQSALRDPATGLPLLLDGTVAGRTQTDRFRNDWLASFEPSPGTVAFFGYGATLTGEEAFEFRNLRRTDDGFFVKVSYLFRR